MGKIDVSKFVSHIHIKSRPNGFMLVLMDSKGALQSYHGCVELREGRESVSFFYRVFGLIPELRTYELSLFEDNEWRHSFLDVAIHYVDHDSSLISIDPVQAKGDWEAFLQNTCELMHILIFTAIIQNGQHNAFLPGIVKLFDGWAKNEIEEQTQMTYIDIISTCNLLLQ